HGATAEPPADPGGWSAPGGAMSLRIYAARLAGDRPIRLVEAGGRPGAVRDRRQTGVRLLPPLDSTAMPDVRDSFSRVAANYSKSTFHTSSARRLITFLTSIASWPRPTAS